MPRRPPPDAEASIRILRATVASGRTLAPGEVCRVPAEVSLDDARLLLRLGKAVPVEQTRDPAPPRGGVKR